MPIITVEGPKIEDMDRKRQLVNALTEAAVGVYGMDKEHIIVLIRENVPQNVGVGGQLIVDRRGG